MLAQAIGGIVHDLGNPLTVVQMSADFLGMDGAHSPDVEAIQEAAQMLNALRLSLIEQTRVLEGKAIPVDLRIPNRCVRWWRRETAFRTVATHTSARYHSTVRHVEVMADRPKLVTVFMNLIGNSLKYSDGEVRVIFGAMEGDVVLVGITDQGKTGRGIS